MPDDLNSARSQRDLARAGLWTTGPVQLELPLTAEGLSEVIRASGRLKLTPDFDVLAWVGERWLQPAGDDDPNFQNRDGWALFTLRELGFALYGREPNHRDRVALRESLRRLYRVEITLIGYDGQTGERDRSVCTWDRLVERVVSDMDELTGTTDPAKIGALRGSTFKASLPRWLRQQLVEGHFVRVHWPTLRSFTENQPLAKRLWIYLAAENYKPVGGGLEATWVPVGDRLFTALGMNYTRHRAARDALARACRTIRMVDVRYRSLDVVQFGRSWRITADRLTAEELRALGPELRSARQALRENFAA
jgi:hypothetical protein